MPTVDDFRSALLSQLQDAELRGAPYIEVNSGQLHRKLGGYPGTNHQMTSCCKAMYDEQMPGDEVISKPPKGKGASLTIRYQLPRSTAMMPTKGPRRENQPADAVAPKFESSAEIADSSHLRLTIGDYEFKHVCDIKPLRNAGGTVQQFMPQSQYENSQGISLNKYGGGPFCKFKIPSHIQGSGVYVLTIYDEIKYVGECANLSARFNAGYGNISPRNCFERGQETNCRLNNLVCLATGASEKISLWFFRTADYKTVEAGLRATLRPAWNRV